MSAVTLVDYGLGNIQAFANIYKRLNINVDIATTPVHIKDANRIILPGVGAFDWAMARLNGSGLRDALDDAVLGAKIPVIGVCVGMQMMARSSDEGALPGLGWINAEVKRFAGTADRNRPLPHMGWNTVEAQSDKCLFKSISAPRFYHLHSYCVIPNDQADILAKATYGAPFAAAIRRDNVFGTQFHPEKSHQWGINLLRNFAEL